MIFNAQTYQLQSSNMWSLKLNHINFKAPTCELQSTNYLCTEQTTQTSTSERLSLRLLCHCPVIKIDFQCCNTVWQLHTPAMMKGTKILRRIVRSTACATALGKPTVACLPTLHNCLSAPICAIIIRSNWIPSCDAPRTRCPVVLHKLHNCKYASWSDTQPWSLQICDICPQNLSVFRRILSHSYWCICIFPPSLKSQGGLVGIPRSIQGSIVVTMRGDIVTSAIMVEDPGAGRHQWGFVRSVMASLGSVTWSGSPFLLLSEDQGQSSGKKHSHGRRETDFRKISVKMSHNSQYCERQSNAVWCWNWPN